MKNLSILLVVSFLTAATNSFGIHGSRKCWDPFQKVSQSDPHPSYSGDTYGGADDIGTGTAAQFMKQYRQQNTSKPKTVVAGESPIRKVKAKPEKDTTTPFFDTYGRAYDPAYYGFETGTASELKRAAQLENGSGSAPKTKKLLESGKAQLKKAYERSVRKLEELDPDEFGNGAPASGEFNPVTWTIDKAKAELKEGMKGYESKGVTFKTVSGLKAVTAAIREHVSPQSEKTAKDAIKYITRLEENGQLLGVVHRGVTGGKAVGFSYFSNPQYIDIWTVGPDGKGKNITLRYELGD